MPQLQKGDSADKHLKAASYHIKRCRSTTTDPLFATLAQEMFSRRKTLKEAMKALEDQQEVVTDLTAEVDAAELALEDIVRNLKGDLERLDRRLPGKNALKKVMPEGSDGIIDPDGEAQLDTLPSFRSRLKELEAEPELSADVVLFDKAVITFEAALETRKEAEKTLAEREVDEENAREGIRKQLVTANGQLEGLFSTRPALARRFFYKATRTPGLSREDRARAQGQSEMLLKLIAKRGLEASEEDKKKIQTTLDLTKLERWLDLALAAAPSSLFVLEA